MRKNKMSGITIIALVVTIVVILILAGVVISLIKGENGTIDNANKAKEETIIAREKENIKLAYQEAEMNYQINGGEISTDDIKNALNAYDKKTEIKEIDKNEIDQTKVVVEKNSGSEYAEITYTETQHKYAVSLLIDPTKARYTVTYNANGGQGGPSSQTKTEGKSLILSSETPTREDYTFDGWAERTGSTVASYKPGDTYTLDQSVTLYAVWKEKVYNISYNLDGGTEVNSNPTQYTVSSSPITLNNPQKYGYVFEGWTGTGLAETKLNVEIPTGSKGDREYTAHWMDAVYIVDETTYTGTLNEALDVAQNGSNIRLLKNKTETEDVSINLSVTLELSGFTITQNNKIVIEETGSLTIKDSGNNSEYTGKIINTNGVAIQNKGSLTLGEDEGTILMSPTIEGKTTGIVTTGTFNFFDGQVIGTVAIEGEEVTTPITYYAMAGTQGEKEIVTLNTLGNAVCRIGYKYYSTIDAATEECEEGEYEYVDKSINLQGNGTYSFVCNENGTLTPNNIGVHNSVANSYIELDLLDLVPELEYNLTINAEISSQSYDYGYATITTTTEAPTASTQDGRFMYISGTKTAADYSTTLRGGNKYYLHLGYSKNGSGNSGSDKVTINSINLNGEVIEFKENTCTIKIPKPIIATEKNKITLVTNVTMSNAAWTIPDIKNIKLDLNGFVLSASGNINTIVNKGSLEITDSSENQTGNVVNSIYTPIVNKTGEELKIAGANLKSSVVGTSKAYKYLISNTSGKVNIENSKYTISHNYNEFLNINSNGQWNIKESTINVSNSNSRGIFFESSKNNAKLENNIITSTGGYGIYSSGTGKIIITGGEITSTQTSSQGVYNSSTGEIEISGVKFNKFSSQIYNYSTGTIKCQNLELNDASSTSLYNNNANGIMECTNITIDQYRTGIENNGIMTLKNISMTDTNSQGTYAVKNKGTINIEGITVEASVPSGSDYGELYGLYNYENGTMTVSNANIHLENNSTHYNVWGSSTVAYNTYGIYNVTTGTLTLKSGIIYCSKLRENNNAYGVYSSSTNPLIIGEKDGNINNSTTNIFGTSYGVYNGSSNFSFYDGILRGTKSYGGVINDIETNSEVQVQVSDSIESMQLISGVSDAIEIVETGIKYKTIEEAVAACNTNSQYTLKVLKNLYIANNENTVVIEQGRNIALDLNSYEVYIGEPIINNGNLKITDTSGNIGKLISNQPDGITNNSEATLEISNCQYTNRAKGISTAYTSGIKNMNIFKAENVTIKAVSSYCNAILNEKTLEVNNSTITCSSYGIGINNIVNATSTLNNITMSSAGSSSIISNAGSLTLNTGSMTTSGTYTNGISNSGNGVAQVTGIDIDFSTSSDSRYSYGIISNDSSTVKILDSVIKIRGIISSGSHHSYGVTNKGTGNIEVENSEIINTYVAYGVTNTSSGKITLKNTNVSSYNSAISNSGTGTIEIDGGILDIPSTVYTAISNGSSGTITIKNATVTSNDGATISNSTGNIKVISGNITSRSGYAINNSSTGNIIISGGTVISNKTDSIYNTSTGSVIIGTKDRDVSIESPEIIGETYGIYNNTGIINFYDGVIKGKTDSIKGAITEIEEEFDIIRETEESGYYKTYLGKVPIAQIGDNQYNDIQEAINSIDASNEEKTIITILRDATILNKEIINQDKKIILDFNGKVIKDNMTITNNSELEIIDSSEGKTGRLHFLTSGTSNNYGIGLKNIGMMKITDFRIEAGANYCISIENEGTLEALNITINNSGNTIGINNTTTGVLSTENIVASAGGSSTIISNFGMLNTNGGTLINSGSYVNGISNNEEGTVITTGLTLDFTKVDNNRYCYGILNNGAGNIKVLNANITIRGVISSGYHHSYGVTNKGTGNIEVENSEITNTYVAYGVTNTSSGKITLKNTNVSSYNSAISNSGTGTIEIDGGTVDIPSTVYTAISNGSSGNITIKNATVSSNSGATISNSIGNIKVISGSIVSRSGYAINNSSTGNITIGLKDGIVNTTNPEINGSTYGIYNISGTTYFYDGIIKGKTDSVYGAITEVEEGYDGIREFDSETSYYNTYLAQLPIAQIGETEYYNLQEAIDSIDENNTETTDITILRDATITNKIQNVNKKIKLNLNGKYLKCLDGIINKSELEIIDVSENSLGILQFLKAGTSNEYFIAIENTGILKLTSGSIKSAASYCTLINNTGNVIVLNSSLGCSSSNVGITNRENATLEIDGTIISTTGSSTLISNSGELNFKSGELKTTGSSAIGISNNSTGKTAITGGIINFAGDDYRYSYGIKNTSANMLQIQNMKINVKGDFSSGSGSMCSYGFTNEGTGKVIIDNCEIFGGSYAYGIRNNKATSIDIISTSINTWETAITNIEGGTITIQNSEVISSETGVSNSGTLIVKSGKIQSGNPGMYTSPNGITNYETGTVFIGEQGGEVNTKTPEIVSQLYGIYNNGTMYFYDGVIKGKTATYNGTNIELEKGHQIYKVQDEDGYYCDTLVPVGGVVTVATIGSVNYASLQDAISACVTGEEVIVLQRDITLDESNIIIEEDKIITINLNGKIITSSSTESTITNNGTLTIKDTSGGGKVENTVSVAIKNNGTLTIGVDDGTENTASPIIRGKTSAVTNNGTYNRYDGVDIIE